MRSKTIPLRNSSVTIHSSLEEQRRRNHRRRSQLIYATRRGEKHGFGVCVDPHRVDGCRRVLRPQAHSGLEAIAPSCSSSDLDQGPILPVSDRDSADEPDVCRLADTHVVPMRGSNPVELQARLCRNHLRQGAMMTLTREPPCSKSMRYNMRSAGAARPGQGGRFRYPFAFKHHYC